MTGWHYWHTGFADARHERLDQDIAFKAWTQRMRCSAETVERLDHLLDNDLLRAFLRPREEAGERIFTLQEAIIVARKPGSPIGGNITDWQRAAPPLTDFEDMADIAWDRLPEEFRSRAGDVLIRVEDYPTDEVLDSSGSTTRSICSASITASASTRKACRTYPRSRTWCSSTAGRCWMNGPNSARRWAISSPTSWCTRSATISAFPTTTWNI